jgi:broad specificity phosphatase PhoE
MQHLLLIRHGQTDANAQGVIQGHLPTPLNEVGREQSRLLGRRLREYQPPVERILSSPLPRALETAEIVADCLGLRVETDEAWVERHFGSQQGLVADLLQIMTHGGQRLDAEDAEPRHLFDERIRAAVLGLSSVGTTAVVSHGGVIGSVVRQLIGGAVACINPPLARAAVPNCSILHLCRSDSNSPFELLRLHDAAHLAGLQTDRDEG